MLSPLFIMSALTMFFFLGGMEVGLVFVSQILNGMYVIPTSQHTFHTLVETISSCASPLL